MMKANDNVGVTFVNTVVASGVLNGVINLTLGVALFTPDLENKTVTEDLVVASRLRMDAVCAMDLYRTLGRLLDAQEKPPLPEASQHNGVSAPLGADEKPETVN